MFTVTQLAKRHGISRATVLYYERQGLLHPAKRSANGYRFYGEPESERLGMIVAYRSYGIPIQSIGKLLSKNSEQSQSSILREHFHTLNKEIAQLKHQQKAIIALLQENELENDTMVTKDRWVEIMTASGLDEAAMIRWHQKFEEMEPDEHQKFLESLNIDAEEIIKIRGL